MQNRLEYRRIGIKELPILIPNFSSSYEPKDFLIKKWLMDWILLGIKENRIRENDILPSKKEIAEYLGVSLGTVQNAIRYIEDEGLLTSKQKVGTMVLVSQQNDFNVKSTSKREKAVLAIEKIIVANNYKVGKPIPSARKMSEYLGITKNTTRMAYEYLCLLGIIESLQMRGNDSNWYLKKIPQISDRELKYLDIIQSDTIVDKLTQVLSNYFSDNFKAGDRLPSYKELSEIFKVSSKTIHDCVNRLIIKGIVSSRRGKYGCILIRKPDSSTLEQVKENSVLNKVNDSEVYNYQKIGSKIVTYINENYEVGDKLPTLKEFSILYKVSTNTVRKALVLLEQEGFIHFSRGRFGGTYLVQKPEIEQKQQYKWLSISPDYMET